MNMNDIATLSGNMGIPDIKLDIKKLPADKASKDNKDGKKEDEQ
jgi:hypothetical protein